MPAPIPRDAPVTMAVLPTPLDMVFSDRLVVVASSTPSSSSRPISEAPERVASGSDIGGSCLVCDWTKGSVEPGRQSPGTFAGRGWCAALSEDKSADEIERGSLGPALLPEEPDLTHREHRGADDGCA